MMMSLDGFAAGPHDEMDWLPAFNDEEMWKDLHEAMWNQLRSVDTFLLGRVTYQIWEKYWPAAGMSPMSTQSDLDFSRFADTTQKVVFSRTLDRVDWKNTRLVRDHIPEEIARLKQQPGKNLAVAGGAGLARSFIQMGLVDDYQIIVHPVILGVGKPLFQDMARMNLRLLDTRPYRSGAVLLHYQPAKRQK